MAWGFFEKSLKVEREGADTRDMQPRRTGAMVAISAAVFALLAATGASADDTAAVDQPAAHQQPAGD